MDQVTVEKPNKLTEEKLLEIIARYDTESVEISTAYGDGGIDPLWSRFERAVVNQISDGDAKFSRYAIWANSVRDNILEGLSLLNSGDSEEAKKLFIRSANSLSAFSDVQAYYDPFHLGKTE